MTEFAREVSWAGGTHKFNLNDRRARLRMQVIGLPGVYGNTAAAAFRRLGELIYSTDDVERVIEWGLIGGGMSSREANALIDAHVRLKPLAPNVILATTILSIFITGAEHADAST